MTRYRTGDGRTFLTLATAMHHVARVWARSGVAISLTEYRVA